MTNHGSNGIGWQFILKYLEVDSSPIDASIQKVSAQLK